jgi:hypothetical protein
MPLDLIGQLKKFQDMSDRETSDAFFLTHVPTVGSAAFLNIVYKAAPTQLRLEIGRELRLPPAMVEFYSAWNGARLFVGALSIYGCVPEGQLLDRTDPTKLLPFNIREVNHEFQRQLRERELVCIGSYSYDRSIVCMDRRSQAVICHVGKDFGRVRHQWTSLDQWLTDELARLSLLFDERGNRLVEKDRLLPGLEPARVV